MKIDKKPIIKKTTLLSSDIDSRFFKFSEQNKLKTIKTQQTTKENNISMFTGLINSIEHQIRPKSRMKVTNLWRIIKGFDENQTEFERVLKDVLNDDELRADDMRPL